LERRVHELPRDRDIIVYCACPNEVSSASLALQLHRRGFTRVRPLQGGIEAWRGRGYPTEPLPNAEASAIPPDPSPASAKTLPLSPEPGRVAGPKTI
jgi:3-mercaptopyruvate sulfurtransferase SseA